MGFDKKDIEILDIIINKVSNQIGVFNINDLKTVYEYNDNGYGSLVQEFKYKKEFKRLMDIINSYNVCECSFKDDALFIRVLPYTAQFIEQGGFKKQYEIFTENNRRKEVLYEKDVRVSEYTKLKIKSFPFLLFFSIVSFLFSTYTFISDQNKQKKSVQIAQELKRLKQELNEIQTFHKKAYLKKKNHHKDILILNDSKRISEKKQTELKKK